MSAILCLELAELCLGAAQKELRERPGVGAETIASFDRDIRRLAPDIGTFSWTHLATRCL